MYNYNVIIYKLLFDLRCITVAAVCCLLPGKFELLSDRSRLTWLPREEEEV